MSRTVGNTSETRWHVHRVLLVLSALASILAVAGCTAKTTVIGPTPTTTPTLTVSDVLQLVSQAVEQADRAGATVAVAVTDREGNVLVGFSMTGAAGTLLTDAVTGAIAKARTAAYLSSNQHGFSSLTACFITRPHFPPGISNTAGGPLYGVPFSGLGGGDIQPNGDLAAGRPPGFGDPGLTGVPGGIPVFKNGLLAGGLGVSGGSLNFDLDLCTGPSQDESIALGAVFGFEVPALKRGDQVFIDGIRLRFANATAPSANYTFTAADVSARGAPDALFPPRATPPATFPVSGEVDLDGGVHDFSIIAGTLLSQAEVQQIIDQAVAQSVTTRAAIRRPIGTAARVFITVADVDGTILGIWRTPDATLFSFDVSAQKARTAVAYSDPTHGLGQSVRSALGLASGAPLALTCRALGYLTQDFYPPGIDEETLGNPVEAGPLYIGPEFVLQQALGLLPFGNGIQIFPGGIPLYRGTQLVGGIGVSGDGVDQDDYIAWAGSAGFRPPDSYRCDNIVFKGARLPFLKFPRRPELGGGS